MTLTKKNLIFLGAPGAGKGTVSNLLLKSVKLAHISTGDLLRAEVAAKTELGVAAAKIMASGNLVPDEIVAGMVRARLAQDDCKDGFILDGFPRTLAQADLLDAALKDISSQIDAVVYLHVDEEILIQRLTSRLNCRGCDAIYNKVFMPPKVEGVCDKCGSALYQRPDDSVETAKSRLDVFARQTEPLIQYYRDRDLLLTIEQTDAATTVAKMLEKLR
ncbi:MAG: adenylate kinase [Victivallaceae bacterium]|nr:adenylate kinase [Victivallaceae bacterium]